MSPIANTPPLDLAFAVSTTGVSVTLCTELRRHWSDEAIVEIVAIVPVEGFLSRWVKAMGTPFEPEPMTAGEKYLRSQGWSPSAHG
jgi:hypothetical protein